MMHGLCSYRDIKESRVDLCDLDIMNELITVRLINERRAAEAQQRVQEQAGKPATFPFGNGLSFDPFPSNSFDARWRR